MLKRIAVILCSIFVLPLAIYFTIAGGMILSQWPKTFDDSDSISFTAAENVANFAKGNHTTYKARDGSDHGVRHFPSQKDTDVPLVIVIHGPGWQGSGYINLATSIFETGDFEVLVPDLRGHEPDTTSLGDVSYIGQLEDDLMDLVKAYRKPDQKVIMIGHSSGGGLVIRFAGSEYGNILHKAVLMAPFLKYNAPTVRENSAGWGKALNRRLIGISMLNYIGITGLNNMTVLQFTYPESILEGTQDYIAPQSYSYRLKTSFAPRDDYLKDVAALPEFLLVVGEEDGSFIAEEFEPVLSPANPKGTYKILENTDHIGISDNESAVAEIIDFIRR